MTSMFRSFSVINYRAWFAGALVSNIGTWMQRTAQDWIVLTDLGHGDAVAVGTTMALQFGPAILLVPWTGVIADRFDRRKLLMITQALMGALGLALGAVVLSGVAQLWMLYAFALLLGIVTAFDTPARQAFVSELVPPPLLPNAVSLNSASFNGARLIGPAVAGVLVAVVGAGPVFIINGASFVATLLVLVRLNTTQLQRQHRAPRGPGQLREGLRYVRSRPDIQLILVTNAILGTLGFNFPIYSATMSSTVFHRDASGFGLVSSIIAIGSVTGSLLSARRERPRMRTMVLGWIGFSAAACAAAWMPSYLTFALLLAPLGFSALTIMTTANALVQTTVAPTMRGRVMALYFAVFTGGTPIGAPIIGAISNAAGPRWAFMIGGLSGIACVVVFAVWLVVVRGARLAWNGSLRMPLRVTFARTRPVAADEMENDELMAARTS